MKNNNFRKTVWAGLLVFSFYFLPAMSQAQGVLGGHVTGNMQLDMQMSREDSTIGAPDVPEQLLMNARADILYTNGAFDAGLRFEAYTNPLLGFDKNYRGQGIANYFVSYHNDRISFTAGYFYEQFGNGMILRTYEDRNIGYDNALFGFNVHYQLMPGIMLKGVIGKQRYCWTLGNGIVRGVDAEVQLNSLIPAWADKELRVTLGGGVVSRYEPDTTIFSSPGYKLNLPLNVGAFSTRMDLAYRNWNLNVEYARKGQDPSFLNNYIYRYGQALTVNASYATRGFSVNLQAKRVDNMVFKSERAATDANGAKLYINYIPAINKEHTYAFLSMYPYSTQAQGEMGLQGDIIWRLPKDGFLGGTDIHLNSSVITALDMKVVGGMGTEGYTSDFFGTGDLYYGDASLEVTRKINSQLKLTALYGYQVVNPEIDGHSGALHHNNVVVGDLLWKINKKNALRFEAEWMGSDSRYTQEVDDKRCGDWIMGLMEYNFTSRWFVSVSDQYAYHDGTGNYYNISLGYTHNATRIQLGYGKQREGMICIGGVCRQMPALNGLTLTLSTSF